MLLIAPPLTVPCTALVAFTDPPCSSSVHSKRPTLSSLLPLRCNFCSNNFLSSPPSNRPSSNHHSLLLSFPSVLSSRSHFFFLLISPQPFLPRVACDEERYTLSSSLHKWREAGVRIEGEAAALEGCWDSSIFKGPIFSFVCFRHFTAV